MRDGRTVVLVTGGRAFGVARVPKSKLDAACERGHVFDVLDGLAIERGPLLVVQGGAEGADAAARTWVRNGLIRDSQTWRLSVHRKENPTEDDLAEEADAVLRRAWDHAMLTFEADWSLGRSAGPARNRRMVEFGADLAVAFPGGSGTADCVKRIKAAGIPFLDERYPDFREPMAWERGFS